MIFDSTQVRWTCSCFDPRRFGVSEEIAEKMPVNIQVSSFINMRFHFKEFHPSEYEYRVGMNEWPPLSVDQAKEFFSHVKINQAGGKK